MTLAQRLQGYEQRRDRGLTLVELVVAASLLSLVLVVVGGIFTSLINAERTVTPQSQGATAAQLAASSISTAIRNSSEFRITDVGADQLLVARVAGTAANIEWSCQAWYFTTAGDGEIRSTIVNDGAAILAPTPAQLADWTLLIAGVAPPAGQNVFVAAGSSLTVAFDADAGDSPTIAIRLTAASLTSAGEEATCF
ncbi:MAG: prepilin-type N-terminal cleavage/methylation domain-containing protein [Microcella sp.]|uniref:prepilin-type N-terminal cleavage/methylation domain-containing protein n=1 Tax=Microcella sp. TaxID=1913979 RepID=UPI0024CAC6E1|nr:prepilin-type N-terminal cleavage/methylation domain-containing protein [Microcella sp.]UYN83281.1 MAG: prepilin-type N-terminal cleavage/methylation domain-containing protein [Microcella sp.]